MDRAPNLFSVFEEWHFLKENVATIRAEALSSEVGGAVTGKKNERANDILDFGQFPPRYGLAYVLQNIIRYLFQNRG